MDIEVRSCKFGGVECLWSDRARADCYVCGEVRAKLSALSRLQRENLVLTAHVRQLQTEIDRLEGERDRACRALGVSWGDVLAAA